MDYPLFRDYINNMVDSNASVETQDIRKHCHYYPVAPLERVPRPQRGTIVTNSHRYSLVLEIYPKQLQGVEYLDLAKKFFRVNTG